MSFYENKVKNFRIAIAYDGCNILITDGESRKVYPINEGDVELPTEMVLNAVGAAARSFVDSNYVN